MYSSGRKKKILSRQKVSKALNTQDLMVSDDTTWSGYSEGLSTSEQVTPLKSTPKSTFDQKKILIVVKKKKNKTPTTKAGLKTISGRSPLILTAGHPREAWLGDEATRAAPARLRPFSGEAKSSSTFPKR